VASGVGEEKENPNPLHLPARRGTGAGW